MRGLPSARSLASFVSYLLRGGSSSERLQKRCAVERHHSLVWVRAREPPHGQQGAREQHSPRQSKSGRARNTFFGDEPNTSSVFAVPAVATV